MTKTAASVLLLLAMSLTAMRFASAESILAGNLPRQADVQFRTSASPDGLTVERLEAESPAAGAGLRDGDLIVAINGQTWEKPYIGEDLLRRLDGNQRTELAIRRDGSERTIRFRPVPKALEEFEGITTTFGVLNIPDGSRLRTIITRPAGARGKLPAVFLVQWVSCSSVEYREGSTTREILAAIAQRSGMAMIRVERSTAGDSEGPACHELDYNTEIEHYRYAFDVLTRSEGIDPDRIVILGMSLGSTVAPLVVHDKNIIGITVGGGGAVTYFERMLNFDRINLERGQTAPEDIHDKLVKRILFQTEYLLRDKTPEQIADEHPELADVWNGILGSGDGVHYGRPYAYHQQAAKKDFLEAWTRIDAPVLVTFGEYDQFEMRHGHELIPHIVNQLRPGTARFVQLDKMGHDYRIYSTAEDAYSWTYGPSAPANDATELVIGEILRWLKYDVGIDTVQLGPASGS